MKSSISSPFRFLFILFVAAVALYAGLWGGHNLSSLCPVDTPAPLTQTEKTTESAQSADGAPATESLQPAAPVKASPPASNLKQALAKAVSCGSANKVLAWAYDVRITDLLLLLFIGMVTFRLAGLERATRALQTFGADQAQDAKQAIAIAQESAQTSHRQAELARQAVIDGNRAFVFVEKIEWKALHQTVDGVKKLGWGFVVHWRNGGTTPTRRMQSCVYETIFIRQKPLENFPYADDRGHDDVAIFPRATAHSRPLRVDPEYFALAQSRHGKIFIWGWADYDDFFEGTPRRRTEFCFAVEAMGNPNSPDCKFAFSKRGPFNGQDEDCMREPQPFRVAPPLEGEPVDAETLLKSA